MRGRGSQKDETQVQFDDKEEAHVLVIGSSGGQCLKACHLIEDILFSDQETLVRI